MEAPSPVQTSPYHQQLVIVAGFLGGAALTALVLVVTNQSLFENGFSHSTWGEVLFDLLAMILAGTSASFIFACLGAMPFASGKPRGRSFPRTEQLINNTFSLGVLGFLAAFPFVLYPFTRVGAGAIAVFEIVVFAISVYFTYTESKRAATSSGSGHQ